MSSLIEVNGHDVFYFFQVGLSLSWCLGQVSILTSVAISVDRLLALLLGLIYKHVVSLWRVRVVIICFWLIGALAGWTRMHKIDFAYKEALVVLTLSLLTAIFCYTKVHLKLQHQQAQLHNNAPQGPIAIGEGIPLNKARFKKTASSILWVQLTLVTCYIPLGIVIALSGNGISYVALRAMETVLFLNSSLNPILYCWKIREVKQAVRDTLSSFTVLKTPICFL